MARRPDSFDLKRARIAALASSPSATATAELRRYLGDRVGYIVGDAAEVASRLELGDLVPDLVAALERLLSAGLAADKGCSGKARVLEALLRFEADACSVYLACLRYEQLEPALGKPIDTAAPLRGLAAHALVQIDARDAVAEIAPLLTDPEPLVRAEAARALGLCDLPGAAPVLHLKILTGDVDPDVLQNAYGGLLRLDARRYLPVVGAVLATGDQAAEAAALALGESRHPEAFALLREALGSVEAHISASVLMAIALSRLDGAVEVLLAQIDSAPEARATEALAALALHKHDATVVARARAAVEARGSRSLAGALRAHLGP